MSPILPDSHRDLLDEQIAIISTIDDDGFPHSTAVWFLFDEQDGRLKTSVNGIRMKAKYLQARPQCNLLILDPKNPMRYLMVRALAKVTPDPDYVFADRIKDKYGLDLRQIDQPGETRLQIVFEPVKVYAIAM